jgi:hypothetical protein
MNITKHITKPKILYFIYLFFVIVGIILCGYILYKYICVFYTNVGHEGYQTNTTEYIKFAASTINTKNYLAPYVILNNKPYLICTIIDSIEYKKFAESDFNKKNINYIVDFGIAITQKQ